MDYKVGNYHVYVKEFEDACKNFMESADESSLLVIDEIGKMELHSKKFEAFIKNLLKSPKAFKIIATVPLKIKPDHLVHKIKTHPKAELFHITKMNRGAMYEHVLFSAKIFLK